MTIIKAIGENQESKIITGRSKMNSKSDTEKLALKTSSVGQNSKSIEKLMPLLDKKSAVETKKKNTGAKFSEFKYDPKEKAAIKEFDEKETTKEVIPPKIKVSDETVLDNLKSKFNIESFLKLPAKIHFRKKNAIVLGALALICGALVLNHTLTGDKTRDYNDYAGTVGDALDTGAANVNTDGDADSASAANNKGTAYFSTAAVSRRRARDESLEVLQLVVDNEEALQESKDSALQSMSKIAAEIEKESNIESLIKAKGFEDCIAIVGDEGVTVIVATNGLMANEVAQITEIVCEQTSLSGTGVKIVEKALS